MSKKGKRSLQIQKSALSQEMIENNIFLIRDKKVMLDRDLASLYGVETRVLNQAVTRNIERFPEDFMFQLTKEEFNNLKSQIVTSSWGGVRKFPYVFTELGVAMLSSVIRSPEAIQVNIQIMRAFTRLRELMLGHEELRKEIETMRKEYDQQFEKVFEAIGNLLKQPKEESEGKIGFK